jgi:hypothetical protein
MAKCNLLVATAAGFILQHLKKWPPFEETIVNVDTKLEHCCQWAVAVASQRFFLLCLRRLFL